MRSGVCCALSGSAIRRMRIRRFSMASILQGTVHAEARRRGGREVVDDATQAFFESCGAEVDEEADVEIREAEIGEELFVVHGRKFLDRLDLDDRRDRQRGGPFEMRSAKRMPSYSKLRIFCLSTLNPLSREHASKNGFVDGLQQSGPKRSMNLNRRIDDRARNLVQFVHLAFLRVSASPRETSLGSHAKRKKLHHW